VNAEITGDPHIDLGQLVASRELELLSRREPRPVEGRDERTDMNLSTSMHRRLTREQGLDLMARAHQNCRYSRATRGGTEPR
jgi:organic hydroperoxide reductase OsmC/OhrA